MLESRGDGAWIMKKCSDCLQGTVGYTFEPRRTIFELSCPAPVRLDELELEQMPLGSNVWGVGVDDCEFQRLILGGLFESVGLPAGRVEVLGGRPEDLERLSDWLVTLLRERLPAHARVLTLTPTLALALALALSRALALTLTLTLTFTLTLTLSLTLNLTLTLTRSSRSSTRTSTSRTRTSPSRDRSPSRPRVRSSPPTRSRACSC